MKLMLIFLIPTLVSSCVVGDKEDVLDYQDAVIEYAFSCQKVGKNVETCKKELRDAHQ